LHRRLAAAIEQREPDLVDENAALIAEHLEAAGDLHAAFAWHMRAATWATNRDIGAARLSWEGARTIATPYPPMTQTGQPCASPLAPCCAGSPTSPSECCRGPLRRIAGVVHRRWGKASLAIAMAGLVADHAFQGRMREASQLASEAMALIESVGDATLTVGLSFPVIYAKIESAEWCDVLRWSQRAIDLADGTRLKATSLSGLR